ncbi:PRD domain-containing protein [Facklamia sp. DSM 111018]|uniref:PRD domain-containing protein n=1 Tax=Facklamia lactis TaxID=2749967 RepID=A0ABS0LSX6_9LACT|nr:PRD domain-containing protein [Facklamia lactis]MBG9979393.1 PRD domain-containing protein [Facklamia lactis]MBG9987268.1 PRD domain-containing protein [Facklamia lactis]
MKVVQSLNQNAVIVLDQGKEVVLTGKGIGFGKKVGDEVDTSKISKIYQFEYTSQQKLIVDSIKEVPEDILLITEDLLDKVEDQLNDHFAPFTTITFASHLHHAIERTKQFKTANISLQHEFKHIFPKEYQAAIFAIDYLESEHDIQIDDLEVTFFIMHFLNGLQKIDNMETMLELGNIINDILNILNRHLMHEFDANNIFYSRFIVHLRYFLMRKLNNNESKASELEELFDYISAKFSRAKGIVEEFMQLLSDQYQLTVEKSEQLYLILHVQRLLDELEE